jgi:hypothetical protein
VTKSSIDGSPPVFLAPPRSGSCELYAASQQPASSAVSVFSPLNQVWRHVSNSTITSGYDHPVAWIHVLPTKEGTQCAHEE